MPNPTAQQFVDAERDLTDLGKIVNDPSGTVDTRTGGAVDNLRKRLDVIDADTAAAEAARDASVVAKDETQVIKAETEAVRDDAVAQVASLVTPYTVSTFGTNVFHVFKEELTGRGVLFIMERFVDAGDNLDAIGIKQVWSAFNVNGQIYKLARLIHRSTFEMAIIEVVGGAAAADFSGFANHGDSEVTAEPAISLINDAGETAIDLSLTATYSGSQFRIKQNIDFYAVGNNADTFANADVTHSFDADRMLRMPTRLSFLRDYEAGSTRFGMLPVNDEFTDVVEAGGARARPDIGNLLGLGNTTNKGVITHRDCLANVLVTTSRPDIFQGWADQKDGYVKFYPSLGGINTANPHQWVNGDEVTASALYDIRSTHVPPIEVAPVTVSIRRQGNGNASLVVTGTEFLGLKAGDRIYFSKGPFTHSGNTVDLDGSYVLSLDATGTTSAGLVIAGASALAVAADWANVGSTAESIPGCYVSN